MPVFDGTAARQLVLIDDSIPEAPKVTRWTRPTPPRLRLMQKDLYAELHRRRRRAQIAARRLVEDRQDP